MMDQPDDFGLGQNPWQRGEWLRQAYRRDQLAIEAMVRAGIIVPMEPLGLDEWNPAQDAQPALKAFTGRKGIRFIEECNVYDHEGTMLGSMTLSSMTVMPKWGIPAWLNPAYIRTEIVREDLIRARR